MYAYGHRVGGPFSPALPQSEPLSSLQCPRTVLLPHTGSSLAEGMAGRARSQGRGGVSGWAEPLGISRISTRSGCQAPTRVSEPNSPSGWKLLDPRNGEHMMSGLGQARVRAGPSVPARQRAGGPDPEA